MRWTWRRRFHSPEEDLKRFSERLSRSVGPALHSILVYGSFAGGDYHPERSDLNVLVVLNDVTFEALNAMRTHVQWWLSRGEPAPVILQCDELPLYAKQMPIEFFDLQQNRRVIVGQDPLAGLEVSTQWLKAQCLYELAAKQVLLRRAILVARADRAIRAALIESLPSVLTLFRAALRTFEPLPPLTKLEAAQRLVRRLGFDPGALEAIHGLHLRRKTDNLRELATRYLDLVESVLARLNNLE